MSIFIKNSLVQKDMKWNKKYLNILIFNNNKNKVHDSMLKIWKTNTANDVDF